jgi:hypothetical protein
MQDAAVLGTGELIDLALLGMLAEQARGLDELIDFIKTASGDDLTPTTDVITARVERLVDSGHVALIADSRGHRLAATRSGTIYLLRLLRLQLDPASGRLRACCTALKLCFLELVGRETRQQIVEELIDMRKLQLDRLTSARVQPCRCTALARCLDLAIHRERTELRWLEQLMPREDSLDLVG